MPAGYAAPCPVWSVSPASVSQSGTLTLSATPQAGIDYIYTTAYYAKGSTWLPVTLTGNNAAPSYSSGPAQGSLTPAILSTLNAGTNYIVLWDWLWDATAQCYKGPGLNQCNTGVWRIQSFTLTSNATPTPAPSSGAFSISNQEPITMVPNSSAMFAKPLPSTIKQHIAVAGGPYLSDSATMVNFELNTQSRNSGYRGDVNMQQAISGHDQQVPKYYGQATDPVYKFTSCQASSAGALNNPFHAPSGARPSAGSGASYSDKFLVVWDQTNNNIFDMYQNITVFPFPACPGGGHAGTLADPCPIPSPRGCGYSNFTSPTVLNTTGGDSGWASPGFLPFTGMVRIQEILQGHIYHAIYLNESCNNGLTVFPNTTHYLAGVCTSTTNAAPNGTLYFLDYTPAQLADIKTKVDAWQYPYIEALTIYGGYVGDTGGGNIGIYPSRNESEVAYNVAGIPTPHPAGYTNFYTWLQSQARSGCGILNGGIACQLKVFENIPAEPNNIGGSGTDITAHMHVADQCVAKAQAGVSGGCP